MYIEYKVIKDVLCHRSSPLGDWVVCSNSECVEYYRERIMELQFRINDLEDKID